jgi:leucyl/phenylalanyl-tRNA--protein transferase
MLFRRKTAAPVWIDPHCRDVDPFPDPSKALRDPDGLLALGGNLEPPLLLAAYRKGIYPWYSPDECIQWWTPDPRMVLFPDRLKVSRSLRRTMRRGEFRVTIDDDFPAVIRACAEPRSRIRENSAGPGLDGGILTNSATWIDDGMIEAYCRLHEYGFAHSAETWRDGELVGGLYGVALGRVFYGESMFSRQTDASKVALVHVVEKLRAWGYELIDCQMHTAHLQSLGAEVLPRKAFNALLDRWCVAEPQPEAWR